MDEDIEKYPKATSLRCQDADPPTTLLRLGCKCKKRSDGKMSVTFGREFFEFVILLQNT